MVGIERVSWVQAAGHVGEGTLVGGRDGRPRERSIILANCMRSTLACGTEGAIREAIDDVAGGHVGDGGRVSVAKEDVGEAGSS